MYGKVYFLATSHHLQFTTFWSFLLGGGQDKAFKNELLHLTWQRSAGVGIYTNTYLHPRRKLRGNGAVNFLCGCKWYALHISSCQRLILNNELCIHCIPPPCWWLECTQCCGGAAQKSKCHHHSRSQILCLYQIFGKSSQHVGEKDEYIVSNCES